LELDVEGLKVVIGEGPDLARCKERNPGVVFLGHVPKDQMSHYYTESNVVVFPARSCPLNFEILEALVSGTPVAGHFIPGIKEYVSHIDGFVSNDLELAVKIAQKIKNKHIGELQRGKYTWANTTRCFLSGLVPAV
jgi:glycosyltransferase involved in cell wall biosynthesis